MAVIGSLAGLVLASCGGDGGTASTAAKPDPVTGSTAARSGPVAGSTVASEPSRGADGAADASDEENCVEVEQRTVETAAEGFTAAEGRRPSSEAELVEFGYLRAESAAWKLLSDGTIVRVPDALCTDWASAGVADAVPIVDWLQQLDSPGLPTSFLAIRGGAGTTARLIVDSSDEGSEEAAVLLDDDRVVPLPDDQMRVVDVPDGQPSITALGDRLAVVVRRNDVIFAPPELWLLDATSLTWSPGPALVDGQMSHWTFTSIGRVDDGIIVMFWDLIAHTGEPVDAELIPIAFVAVSDDLEVTPLSPPPDENLARLDVVTAERAFSVINVFDNRPPPARPWAYDLATDSWTEVTNPPWLPCTSTDTCDWSSYADDDRRAVAVGNSVLVEVDPEDLGLLDGSTLEWTDAPEPPFSLRDHHLIAIADDLVLAMPTDYTDEPAQGEAGLLDLAAGAWWTYDIEADLASYLWSSVDTDDAVLLGDHGVEPITVFDLNTQAFREPTAAERGLWFNQMNGWSFGFRADELIAAYSSRNG